MAANLSTSNGRIRSCSKTSTPCACKSCATSHYYKEADLWAEYRNKNIPPWQRT